MKINPNDPKWTAYVLGELSGEESAAIEELLAADDSVLPPRQGRDRGVGSASREYCPDSGENPRLEGDHHPSVARVTSRDCDPDTYVGPRRSRA